MPAGQINYSMSGDPKDVVRAFTALSKKIDQVERKLKRTGQAGRRAGQETSGGMAAGAKGALKFAGALAGVGSIIGGMIAVAAQLRREYEHLKRQQAEAGLAQLTVGQLQNRARMNLPDKFPEADLHAMVKDASRRHNVKVEEIWRGTVDPLSAMGPLSPAQFKGGLNLGVSAFAKGGYDIATTAGGIMDIMKVTGGTARQSAAWLRRFGQQTRVTTLEEQLSTLVPVVTAAKVQGWEAEQAAELVAYLTQLSADITGKQSSTGAIRFMENLTAATTAGGALIPYKQFGRTKYRPLKATGMAGLTEMQDWYAGADPEMRREFAAKLPGRARTKGALLSLIARTPEAEAAYEEARESIPSPTAPGVERSWTQWEHMTAAGEYEPVRAAERMFETLAEGERLRDKKQGLSGTIREGLDEFLAAIPGIRDIDRKLLRAKWEFGSGFGRGDPMGTAIEQLRELQRTKGYGAKFRRAPWSNWGPAFVEDLPAEGAERVGKTWIRPEHWQVPVEHYGREVKSSYMRRTEGYDPKQAASIDRLIVALEKLAASQAADKPQPVEIVADKRPTAPPPVEDHTE